MVSFDDILNKLSKQDVEDEICFSVQLELGPEIIAIVSSRYYNSDEDIGKAVKSILADSITNHIYYEL